LLAYEGECTPEGVEGMITLVTGGLGLMAFCICYNAACFICETKVGVWFSENRRRRKVYALLPVAKKKKAVAGAGEADAEAEPVSEAELLPSSDEEAGENERDDDGPPSQKKRNRRKRTGGNEEGDIELVNLE